MAEYSISSEDAERVRCSNINAASGHHVRTWEEETPEELSCWHTGRPGVHIDRDLQRSLCSNEGSVLSKKTYQQTWQPKDKRELRNVAEGALQY